MSEPDAPPPLVLDTSVAVKFYVPEEGHEQARELLAGGFQTVVVTADERSMLQRIRGTNYEHLAVHLSNVGALLGELVEDRAEAGEGPGSE